MRRSLLLIALVFPLAAAAQFNYVIEQSIPVSDVDGNSLAMPWAGGLNAAQYSSMDLNGDGKEDLVLFDRTANKVITYLNQNNQYRYAPEFEKVFPATITNWVLLRDFNCDGKKDLFTGDVQGIKVFINKTEPGESLSWEQYLFFSGSKVKSPVILTKGFTIKVNLQIQFDDLPNIADMDGDGDLDILNVQYSGNGTLEFHKNFSKERYGTCDSLDFERITQTWGGVSECNCGDFAFNNQPCPIGGRTKHAGGKSLLTMDIDGDNDMDLLLSEASCTQLYALINTGTNQNPVINSSTTFPATNPVSFQLFPAAYFEDVDFDGVKDLIAAPNIFVNDFPLNTPNLKESNWFYRNSGTNTSPAFTLTKKNLLQDQMIDVGDNAVPAFADYDADGDYDMFISRLTSVTNRASISLYDNIGSLTNPEFQFVTDDYLGFSALFLFNVKLQWVDITGDSKIDLVFTSTNSQGGVSSLSYVANKNSGAFVFNGQSVQNTGFVISRSENIYMTDVDRDGNVDILLGKSNGALQYWKNTGPKGSVTFSLEDDSFLGLQSSVLRQNPRCVASDLDADGSEDLLIGDQSGTLKIYSNYRESADGTPPVTDIVFNNILGSYASQNFGGRIWPDVINLYNTDKPTIIVGNVMGGVQVLRNDGGKSLPEEPVVTIYPVPVERNGTLNIRVDRPATMEIFSSLGQRLTDRIPLQPNLIHQHKISVLSSGVYLIRVTSNNKSMIKRIIIY